MKSILGFGIEPAPNPESISAPPREALLPVRSLVTVRFAQSGRSLTYYNDAFVLKPGDHVFVSGKLAGQLGVVEQLTTKFKISLSGYERVISKASDNLRGTWEGVWTKMVSRDRDAMSPEEFRSWILPPAHWDGDGKDGPGDVVIGDGYELDLSAIGESGDFSPTVFERAAAYCRDGKVAYISARDGLGTAFVEGASWYEVNFRLRGNAMTEMYCDCPYPGLCKHLLAAALTIRVMAKAGDIDPDMDFTAIGKERFWFMVACTKNKVTL